MGKKAKKAKAEPNRTKAAKLPKRVAGVKLSKELRSSGAALLSAANSPVGREMIAAGITAVLAAAARSSTVRKTAAHAAEATGKAAEKATQAGATEGREIVDAIGAAAGAVMQRLFEKKSA